MDCNGFNPRYEETCNMSTIPIPPFSESFSQPQPTSNISSNENPLWGSSPATTLAAVDMACGTSSLAYGGSNNLEFRNSTLTDPNNDFVANLLNPSAFLVNKSGGQVSSSSNSNINSEFFNHPTDDFIIPSTASVDHLYPYSTDESILPPGSTDSYFPIDEEIESSDSDEGQAVIEGGYDYEFMRSKEIEDEDLVCPICKLVSREPQQSECCGKVFCKVCVDKLKSSKSLDPSCPNCRQKQVVLYADKRSSRSISNMKVYCKRKRKGCQWSGTVLEAERHLETCEHRRVPCLNNCGKKRQAIHMDRHVKRFCVNRSFQCEDCKEVGQWAYITGDHVESCLEKVVECLNEGCGYRVNRRDLDDHLMNCPKKLLHCSYSDVGCTVTCRQEEMTSHENECMPSHLEYAVKVARAFVVPHRDHLLQVAPVVVRIPNFSQSNDLRSHPFLTSLKGYKMCLLLSKQVVKHRVLFKFCLMPGLYDSSLSWPFHGRVTLVLLNQKEDRHHHEVSITLPTEEGIPRVVSRHGDFSDSVSIGKFEQSKSHVPTSTSGQMSLELENLGYLLDDIMSVRVSCESLKRKSHSSLPGRKKSKHSHKHH